MLHILFIKNTFSSFTHILQSNTFFWVLKTSTNSNENSFSVSKKFSAFSLILKVIWLNL